ncbi:hypothetical protein DL98DRAFT_660473 [Cadophora sp. DSE1049]|nr:hypothetical protein DL98DRAFT_660473 [Cadophora sp. DSE1049]
MNTYQKRTYLVYSRGLLPEDLTLGSLYLDPANPLDGEQKRFECRLRQSDLHTWTGEQEHDEPCTLNLVASRQWLINSGLFALLKAEAGGRGSQEVGVYGKAGRRQRIKKPEKFLNDVVLASPEARVWLADKLSISRTMYYLSQGGLKKQPRIWMVTGIQYITDGVVSNEQTRYQTGSASANIHIPEPISAAVTILGGQGGLSSGFETNHTSSTRTAYGHKNERVWAAQFTQLAVQFTSTLISSNELPNRIPLRDIVDIKSGAVRAASQIADFTLSGESAEVCGLEEAHDMELGGEELLKRMQDVDWAMLNLFCAQTSRHPST